MVEVQLSSDLCRPYNLLTVLIAIIVLHILFQCYSNSYLIMFHYAKKNIDLSFIIRAVEG